MPTFGIATADVALQSMCRFALQELGEVEIVDPDELEAPLACSLLVLDLGEPLREGINDFARCQDANDELPVVLLGRDVSPDLSAELVRLGAADFLSVPFVADALARKVERLLGGTEEPTVRLQTLLPFQERASRQRRRARRVQIPAGSPARARLLNDYGYVTAEIVDLSLEADGWPGGIRLRMRDGALGLRELLEGGEGAVLPFQLKLPRLAGPLVAAGRVVWSCRDRDAGTVEMALQYRPSGPQAGTEIRRFWTECLEEERRRAVREAHDAQEFVA